MYEWIRPEILVPVHGELRHMAEQARFGASHGIPKTVVQQNGDLVRLAPDGPTIVSHERVGRLVLDGDTIVAADGEAMNERRRIGQRGLIAVTVAFGSLMGRCGAARLSPWLGSPSKRTAKPLSMMQSKRLPMPRAPARAIPKNCAKPFDWPFGGWPRTGPARSRSSMCPLWRFSHGANFCSGDLFSFLVPLTLFLVLPFGVRTDREMGVEPEQGNAESAPHRFRAGRVVLRTTIVATIFFRALLHELCLWLDRCTDFLDFLKPESMRN